ncbi:hypothetical protein F5Y10DRAFT_168487 [Nemania abortiva]|nr:hypothetical protein F5Y10DRAFT_168487 [Nemania abortiva]
MGFISQYSTSVSVEYGPDETRTSLPPPLTTIFSPPPECKTPFIEDCHNSECYGYYYPFLVNFLPGDRTSGTLQCLPETTAYSDSADAVYEYSPGLFCPGGMTTVASIGNTFICCHSGLTYSREDCTGTETRGTAFTGPWEGEVAKIYRTTLFNAADDITLYVSAPPVYLIRESAAGGGSGTVSSTTRVSNTQITPSHGFSGASEAAKQTGIKVGAPLGAILALILLGLGYILLSRYRRK